MHWFWQYPNQIIVKARLQLLSSLPLSLSISSCVLMFCRKLKKQQPESTCFGCEFFYSFFYIVVFPGQSVRSATDHVSCYCCEHGYRICHRIAGFSSSHIHFPFAPFLWISLNVEKKTYFINFNSFIGPMIMIIPFT